MRLICVFALSSLLHILLPGTSEAGIMINNLSLAEPGVSTVNGPLGPAEIWTAIRFTTGTGTWQFDKLTARFTDLSDGGAGLTPDGLQIEVRGDAGTNPDTAVLGTLTSTIDIGVEDNYLFLPTASFSLSGLTNYWLVAKPTSNDSFYAWTITTSGADNGQSGWSLADNLLGTATSGTTWASSPLPFPQLVPLLRIDATQTSATVPEPSSVAILGLSFLGFSIRRRFRHSVK